MMWAVEAGTENLFWKTLGRADRQAKLRCDLPDKLRGKKIQPRQALNSASGSKNCHKSRPVPKINRLPQAIAEPALSFFSKFYWNAKQGLSHQGGNFWKSRGRAHLLEINSKQLKKHLFHMGLTFKFCFFFLYYRQLNIDFRSTFRHLAPALRSKVLDQIGAINF